MFQKLVRHFLDVMDVDVKRQTPSPYQSLRDTQFDRDIAATEVAHRNRFRSDSRGYGGEKLPRHSVPDHLQ
jgi:hypothetical protein